MYFCSSIYMNNLGNTISTRNTRKYKRTPSFLHLLKNLTFDVRECFPRTPRLSFSSTKFQGVVSKPPSSARYRKVSAIVDNFLEFSRILRLFQAQGRNRIALTRARFRNNSRTFANSLLRLFHSVSGEFLRYRYTSRFYSQ